MGIIEVHVVGEPKFYIARVLKRLVPKITADLYGQLILYTLHPDSDGRDDVSEIRVCWDRHRQLRSAVLKAMGGTHASM